MKKGYIFIILSLFLLFSSLIGLISGSTKITLSDISNALLTNSEYNTNLIILLKVRLPRVLLAMLIGAGLSASGCVLQGILRNPLAEPYTLGISGGAAFGVTLGIIAGINSFFGIYGTSISAFLGSILSVILVYLFSSKKYFTSSALILAGIILSFVFSSFVLLIFSISRSLQVHSAILWLSGNLSGANYDILKPAAFFILSGIIVFVFFSKDIDLLSLGEEKAIYLGLNTELSRKILFLIASLVTGTSVSAGGIISFVGLLIPHWSRYLFGPSNLILIPASALTGASFLIICDTIARTIIAPVELPVGVITGIAGGIFLLLYLVGNKKWEVF